MNIKNIKNSLIAMTGINIPTKAVRLFLKTGTLSSEIRCKTSMYGYPVKGYTGKSLDFLIKYDIVRPHSFHAVSGSIMSYKISSQYTEAFSKLKETHKNEFIS